MKIKHNNKFLSFLLFVIPLLFTPTVFAGLSDGLVAYYPFNGTANDASGNGNNGTVTGATLTEDRFGSASNAYSFDGNDDKITVNDNPSLNFGTSSFTIAVWIKNNQSGSWKRILTKRDPASVTYWYSLCINSGYAKFEIAAGVSLDSTERVDDNDWHFLLVKRDRSASLFSLFVDGTLQSTLTDTGANLDNGSGIPLEIGVYDSEKYDTIYAGKIDDIRIYNRALSEAEIQELQNEIAATTTTTVAATTTTAPAVTTTSAPASTTTTTVAAGDTTSIPSGTTTSTTEPAGDRQYQIPLIKGWNLISLPLQPVNTAVDQVTASIQGQFSSIVAFKDKKFMRYDPGNPRKSSLKNMEAGAGYWINVTADSCVLLFIGTPASSSIQLSNGWNLVGYNSPFSMPAAQALEPLGQKVSVVLAFTDGKWQVYRPGKTTAQADVHALLREGIIPGMELTAAARSDRALSEMRPGAGYLIKARSAATWSFDMGTTVSPDSGGTVSADGASVSLPPGCANTPVSVSLKKLSEASGELEQGYIKAVSGEYQLMVSGAAELQRDITFSVPVSTGLLPEPPEGFPVQSFLNLETYNDNTGTWERRGSMLDFDASSGMVTVPLAASDLVFPSTSVSTTDTGDPLGQGKTYSTRQWRVTCLTADYGNLAQKEGSPFWFWYYPASLNLPDSVMALHETAAWATDPDIDDYIEYLDYILQAAYKKLLNDAKDSDGKNVFVRLDEPQMVTVRNLGTNAEGQTVIGGPLIIHSSQGLDYLPNIVAHELVHVFQNQYYSKYFIGYAVRWFIEGTADFYSEWVFAPYNKSVDDHYLSVPIDAIDSESFYNLKYFLKWLSETYGANIIGDTLFFRQSSAGYTLYDEYNLSGAINALNFNDDITTAFEKYCWYVMQNPDKMSNQEIKNKLDSYIGKSGYLSNANTMFDDNITFITLAKRMDPLSAVYFVMRSKSTEDAKLVIAPENESGKGIIGTMSYVGVGSTSLDYQGKHTVEQDNGLTVPRLTMLVVKNFKKGSEVEHMLYHPDMSAGSVALQVVYYFLQSPKGTGVTVASTGTGSKITWQTVGNIGGTCGIPADYIKGYDIFDTAGQKLNAEKIPPIVGAAEQDYEISTLDPTGKTVKDFTVVIEDKYGNKWPEIKETATTTTVPGGDTMNLGMYTFAVDQPETYTIAQDGHLQWGGVDMTWTKPPGGTVAVENGEAFWTINLTITFTNYAGVFNGANIQFNPIKGSCCDDGGCMRFYSSDVDEYLPGSTGTPSTVYQKTIPAKVAFHSGSPETGILAKIVLSGSVDTGGSSGYWPFTITYTYK